MRVYYNINMKIKFLTLNVLHGGIFFDNLTKFVKEQNPDIAFFQEVYDGHDKSLERRFRAFEEFKKEFNFLPHAVFEPSIFDVNRAGIGWGNAVFSKFPIKGSKALFFDLPISHYPLGKGEDSRKVPRNLLCVEIDLSESALYGFNIHGIWDTNGADSSRRFQMLQIVKSAIKGKSPAIFAGDTNLLPTTRFVKEIEKDLKSVFGKSLPSTFNMKHKDAPGYATAAVDMIFISPDIKILSKEVPLVDVSDHMPLVMEFEI